jgi:hypothetical protein
VSINAEQATFDTSQTSSVVNIDRDRVEERKNCPSPTGNYLTFVLLSPQVAPAVHLHSCDRHVPRTAAASARLQPRWPSYHWRSWNLNPRKGVPLPTHTAGLNNVRRVPDRYSGRHRRPGERSGALVLTIRFCSHPKRHSLGIEPTFHCKRAAN